MRPEPILDSSNPPHAGADRGLAQRTARGATVTVAAQGIQFVLQLGIIAALGRLLVPEEFGIVAMVTAFSGLLALFKDGGLSVAIVRERDLAPVQLATLFWIQVALGAAIMLVLVALAPVLVWYYREERIFSVVLLVAAVFPVECASLAPTALLHRRMAFAARATIPILGVVASGVVALTLAIRGFSYHALAAGLLASAVVRLIASWWLAKWAPTFAFRWSDVRTHVKLGLDLVAFDVIHYFARNLDHLLIGRMWGAGALGLYSRAYQLLLVPLSQFNNPLRTAVLPAMSRLRSNDAHVAQAYLRFLGVSSLLGMPLVAFLVLQADLVVSVLLGPGWEASATIFRILGVAGFVQVAQNTTGVLMITNGRTRDMVWLGVVNSLCTAVAFLVGLPFGVEGVATAYAIYSVASFLPVVLFTLKGSAVRLRDFALSSGRAVVVAAAVALAATWARLLLMDAGHEPWFMLAAITLVTAPVAFVAFLGAFRNTRELALLKGLVTNAK